MKGEEKTWQDGEFHHFLLAVCAGTPMLLHRVTNWDDVGDRHVKSVTHTLRFQDLLVMGMAEEIPQK